MRGIYKDAKADQILKDAPTDNLDNLPLGEYEEPDPFTREEIDKILSCPTERRQEINMMGFAFWTGLRISELIAVAWEDIDLEKGTVKIQRARVKGRYKQTKTKRSTRLLELIYPAQEWLHKQLPYSIHAPHRLFSIDTRDHKKQLKEHLRMVFLNSQANIPYMSDGSVGKRFWRQHLQKAGVRYRGPNHARHTFISQMLTAGAPREWIVTQAGHTNSQMIEKHYGKWMREDAPNMTGFVSKQLGFSEHFAPTVPQSKNKNVIIPFKSSA